MNKKILVFLTTLFLPVLILAYTVTWTLPYGGETYETGDTVTIQWTSDFAGFYGSINLYQNGSFVHTIQSSQNFSYGNQSYEWIIPSSITTASDYQIELNLGSTGTWYSSTFSISNTGSGSNDDDGSIELLTGNTESGTGGNEQGYPINTWYHDVKHQSLYHASDLGNGGILSGSIITGIKFKINQTPGRDVDSLRIAYNWTSNTTLSSFDTTTVVYGPTNYAMSSFLPNNWVQFDFSSPIMWDGVSNLIIEYSHDNNAFITGGGVYMRDAGQNRGRRGWTDSGAGHYPFDTNMAQSPDSKVASIRLIVQEAGVQPPSALEATPSYQQVDLSWTASTSDSIANYLIFRGTGSGNATKIDSVTSTVTTYSDVGLTNGTTYYYGIKTKQQDGDLSSLSSPAAATPIVETPANLSASAGSQQVTLTWDTPSGSGVAKTYIYRGTSSTNGSLVDSTSDGTTTSKIITGLSNGTTYYFAIKFKGNDNSLGSASSIVSAMPDYTGPIWYVVAQNSSSSGEGSPEDPMKNIRDAIEAAATGDTIMLLPGTYNYFSNRNLDFQYNNDISQDGVKNLTLMSQYGADTTIIELSGDDFIDFQNGETNSRIEGLTIRNSSFGAIQISNSSVDIKNCIFKNNTNEGAIQIQGTSNPVTVLNTLFEGNFAGSSGGAINFTQDGAEMYIINCIFNNNTANDYGGAINQDNNTKLVVVNSLFIDNTSNGWGAGGINSSAGMDGGNTTIINSIFTGNTDNSGSSSSDINTSGYTMDIAHNILQSESNPVFNYGENYVFDEQYILNDPNNGDYSLIESSPAIGLGLTDFYDNISAANILLSEFVSVDYLNSSRIQPTGSNPDLGPIEHALAATLYPAPVENFTASPLYKSVQLDWSNSIDDDVEKYYVYMSPDSGSFTKVDTVTGRFSTSTTISGLTNDDDYWFYVTAVDADGYESMPSIVKKSIPIYEGPAWYVSPTGNNSTGDGSQSGPFSTIQFAIDKASINDTIKLKPGTYTGYGNYDINPQKDLVIMGMGGADSVTIDVNASINNRHYGFNISSFTYSTLKIKGLTIVNAMSNDGNGGAIRIDYAGDVEIEDCVIGPGNRAISGAGVHISQTNVTISGTVIKGNVANMTSGIFSSNVYGVGLHITNNNTNTVTVKNSVIRGNAGIASGNQNDMYGGGFYASGQSSTVNFINTIIFNNELTRDGANGWWSRGGGGAIDGGAQVYFTHTNILKNNATNTSSSIDGRGGALWLNGNNGSSAYFINSIIWGNTASTTDASEQMFASENSPNIQMNYSNAQVATSGTGNLNENPEFTDEDNNVFTLSLRSSLLGAGAVANQGLYPGDDLISSTDLVGNARPGSGGGNPDMGALENALSGTPVPDAPTGLSATAGDGQVDLTWTASSESDVSKYGIYYGTSSGPSVKQQEVSNATSVTVTGLSNNVTYYFRITAIDDDTYESAFSDEVTAKPQFSGDDIYVNSASNASNPDGSTLDSAFVSIQEAITNSAVTDGKRILVAAGTYVFDAEDWAVSGDEYGFSYNDNWGYQQGTFVVSNGAITSLNFNHTNSQYQVSGWTINTQNTYFNDQWNFNLEATSSSNIGFHLYNGTTQGSGAEIGTQTNFQSGWSLNVWINSASNGGSTDFPIIDLLGKQIVIESISGPDSTILDGQGSHSALRLDANENEYTGYSNSTKFIGFTFTNGDDEEPLIYIEGPSNLSSALNWAPTFENCRFTNTTIDEIDPNDNNLHGVIEIKNAEPVFDGCEFRNLNTSINQDLGGGYDIAGPIRMKGTESSTDTAAFRPVFKNCVIAENSLVNTYSNTWNSNNFKGGAIYVGFGALPLFKDTRIDSNKIDIGTGISNWNSHHNAYGGGIYIDNYMSRGEAIKFINTSISYNEIKGEAVYGGGIFAKFPALEFINVLMVGNSIDASYANSDDGWIETVGGAIRWSTDLSTYVPNNLSTDAELVIVNSTITENSITPTNYDVAGAGGAGICREQTNNHDVVIFNSIITNNSITNVDDQTRINLATNYGSWSDNNSLIDFSIIEYFAETGLDEDDLVDTDPGFVGNGDYSLSSASVAIGAGIDEYENIDAPSFDYNSNSRPNPDGSNPDLGAFENTLSTTPFPSKPQNLIVTSEGDSTIVLSWTANSEDDLSEYKIYYGTASANTLLDSVSGTPSYTATGLDNYTTYYFAVSAEDLDGYESGKSNFVSGTPKWSGPIWYVDEYNGFSQSSGDGSPTKPYKDIQDAIDKADPLARTDGLKDTVLVLPGTYNDGGDRELYFKYTSGANAGQPKNLVLKSRDGATATILDGGGSKRLFEIVDGTDTTLQIIGFTITNGGENDGMGNAIKIEGQQTWDNNTNQYVTTPSGAIFKDCIIKENGSIATPKEPPVIYLVRANVRFENCVIENNHVSKPDYSGEGAAIWGGEGSVITILGTKILNNSLTADAGDASGAGVYMSWSNDNKLTVNNSIIAGNTATPGSFNNSRGAGITVRGGTATIINSTIVDNENAGNQTDGGPGIYVSSDGSGIDTKLNVFNSIVYGNMPIYNQLHIDEWANVSHFVSYSILQEEDVNDFEDSVFVANPEFADTTYILHDRSPAIGAGFSESEDTEGNIIYAPSNDLAGNARPNPAGSRPDLGAYEHEMAVTPYPSPVVNLTATPLHKSVLLEWTTHEDNDVVSYVTYISEDSVTFSAVDTVSGRFTRRTTIDSLVNGTDYWLFVTAVDTAENESAASLQAKTSPYYQGPIWYVDEDNGYTQSSGEGSPTKPYKDIQDGIDAATAGDTVLILPGIYNDGGDQELYFKYTSGANAGQPKNLVLKSRDGAATTILDGKGNRVFEIVDGTDTTLQIIGFTITASTGGENDSDGSMIKIHGQAYWQNNQEVITYSSATFKNCFIKDVAVEDTPIELYAGKAVFIDCEISGNTFDATNYGDDAFGGAITVGDPWGSGASTAHFYRSKLINNTITTSQPGYIHGGAIAVGGSNDNDVKLVNTIMAGNNVWYNNSDGGYPSTGGGIKFRGGKINIINSTIVDNKIRTNTNYTDGGSAIQGEDWNQDGNAPQLTIFNSIIYGNTIVTNASSSPMTSHTDQVKFFDWNDDVDVYASYSLIGGDDDLGGDEILFNIDPDFADTTYVLHDRSPAIGAGFSESEDVDGNVIYPPTNDLAGNVRPNPAGSNPDLGAYEHELALTPYPAAVQNMTTTPLHKSVLLEWDFHSEEDVVSYVAYMSEDSISFAAVDTVSGRFSTRTTIDSLTNENDYWFYVTAVDTADYESAASIQQKTSPFFQGPVWFVDDGGGSSNGEGSPEDPMKYIRDAIEESADGDTIMLMPGTYDHSKNRNLDFQYNHDIWQNGVKNLTLMGSGGADTTIINLDGNDFIDFENGESDSRIEGLTITNSSSGAVRVSNSSVSIKNCVFQDNSNTNQNGGAVLVENSNQPVQIENTKFDNNSSNFRGGAVALWSDGGEVFIANCIFINNNANEVSGAVHKDQNTNLMIINSLFQDNTTQSTFGAAGISIMQDLGYAEIINSVFINNTLSNGLDGDVDGPAYVDHTILQSETSPVFSSGDNYVFPDISTTYDTEFSPSIGSGMNEFFSEILDDDVVVSDYMETDYYGNDRIQPAGSSIDLGPIEHHRWEQRRHVYYLATDGDDSNDGLTTSTPFASLSEAFNKSVIRDTIELAAGTYAGESNRSILFNGIDKVIRSTDGAENTVIDCEGMDRAFEFDSGVTDSTIISGLTILNGSSVDGGAVKIDDADPIFDGVIFMDNSASTSGGAVYASNSNAEFVNCVFVGNHAAESAIMAVSGGDVVVDFVTAVGNKGDNDVSVSGDITITNSILWGNSDIDADISVTYSDVQGGAPGGNLGTGNYNGRPGFIDGQNGDFHLQDWSPVIGQANATTGVLYDLEGNARSDSIPDMGAYENALDAASTYTRHLWYVSTAGSDSVSAEMGTITNPFKTIQHALNHSIYNDEIHIESGVYSESLNNWGKDLLVVGGANPSDVTIDGYFEIIGGSPVLYDLHLTNVNGTSDALQINNDAVVTMYNLLITNSNYSGVTVNNDAIAYMENMTIYGNATGIYENSTGTVSAVNSILWNNTAATYGTPTITYSDVGGGYTGTGNINSDPVFVDAANGNFNLQITSPCIDAGDSTSILDSDSTVTDMGAFPLIREFLAGTSNGNVNVTNNESAVITQDFTIDTGDTLNVESGATVYFDPGVTLTVNGVLGASGVAGNPVSFESTDPDSSYGGVIINSGTGSRDESDSFYYMVIQDVGAAFIPLTINGDATIEHVTIAGNDNSTSLEVNSGTVDLNYSILEGSTSGSGTINETGSFTNSTDQFVSYSTNDFTLLSSAAAIDLDTTENWIDPDYTFADAGSFYHDQSSYLADSIVFLYPVSGDTILVSPDSSANTVYGLSVSAQVFNTIGHYKTYTYTQWSNGGPVDGSFTSEYSATSNLQGIVQKVFYTSTATDDLNSMTISEDGVTAQSGYFKIVPGAPDSVWVNEQTNMTMTQLGSLVFEATIFDQFSNLVADNETVTWNIVPVVGNGDGFTLDNSTASTQGGIVNVILSTDPTGNSLAVGDQVKVSATSGTGTHESAVITIIPDDIYNLTMPTELTEAQIDISADVATVYIEAALIDTFDNALEGVEVNWEVVTGLGTGESLSASSTFTNVNGIAWVDLNTSTVSNSDYTVRGWVTENALFSVLMGTPQSGLNSASDTGIMLNQKSGNTKSDFMNISGASTLISLPVRISNNTPDENNLNRDDRSVYDLDDTTAVIHVLPGVTATVELPQDSVDVLLDDQFQIVGIAYDQYGNVVAEGTPVVWEIVPANNYVTIVNSNASITGGQATCDIQIEMNAPWDFDFVVNLSSESITGSTGTYNIDDVTAPDPISDLAINPNVWTSTNDFTLSWSNPYDHAGIFGAHVSIDGNGDSFTEEQNITSLSGLTLPSNALSTFDVWLEDNAGNDESGNAVSIVAKWDDTNPNAFSVTYPLAGWYNQQFLDFEWNASSDETAGLKYYEVTINSTNTYQQHPDSTQISIPDGFSEGTHQWTITVYDSAGNATETSNPQTINIDFTDPVISHNPVLEGSENAPVTITATFDDPMSGIDIAELYYRKGGEVQWQAPVDMKTLNTYQIASSFVTSVGVEYYIYSRDVAGNETYKPTEGHYSISVTIPGAGLSSTDRWPTGIPNGSAVSSYQIISFPGQAANATPTDLLVDDLLAYDDTKWRFFTYSGGTWNEFAAINTIDPGVGYFLIVKDAGFNITTGQTRSVTTDDDFIINFTSGEWVMLGNPFDFSIPLENVTIDDSTNLAADPNFYTYDGANGWVSANKLDPWKGYVFKSTTANQLKIIPRKSNGGLKIANPEIVLRENEWLIDISARNGLGVDKINTVGVLTTANDEYDALDAFEPPMLPGGVSLRIDNRDWAQNGDTYTTDIRSIKEDGEFWDMEIAAEDDRHNVYINFEGLADIPAEFDVFVIDVTLGVAQDLRWKPIYRYAVSNPKAIHDIRFIAGTKEFVQENNAGVELYPDRFSISQNYPNPFNPQTSILITLEDIASIDLIVYNLLGEEVIRISDSELYPAGYHNFIWKGLNRDGKRVASGVYFYMTQIRDMSGKMILNQTNKMIMVK